MPSDDNPATTSLWNMAENENKANNKSRKGKTYPKNKALKPNDCLSKTLTSSPLLNLPLLSTTSTSFSSIFEAEHTLLA